MDYEKEYKSLVAKVKKAHQFAQTDSTKSVLEDILPQLRESEDERVRMELIEYLRGDLDDITTDDTDRWISWLEKQKDAFENGRQLGIMQEQARQELEWPDEKQKERKSTEDVIKKITQNKETATKFLKSAGIMDENGELAEMYRSEQKPAEKPDLVVQLKEHLANTPKEQLEKEWKELEPWDNIGPTVQEFLYGKPVEWSEEDEKKRLGLIKGLENRMGFGWASDPFSREEYIDWLKSLRPQPHWKPSEEQMKALAWYSGNYDIAPTGDKAIKSLYNDLKKLM